jgi:hypothetical protein
VLGRANAIASAIVVSFMVVSFVVEIRDNTADTIKFFFSAIGAATPTHMIRLTMERDSCWSIGARHVSAIPASSDEASATAKTRRSKGSKLDADPGRIASS